LTGPYPLPGTYPARSSGVGISGNYGLAVNQVVIQARVTLDGKPVQGATVTFNTYLFPPTDPDGISVGTVLFPIQVGAVQGGTLYATYQGLQAQTDVYLTS